MKVNDLKDLQKLLQVCQKMGIEAMEVDGIKFNLKPLLKASRHSFNKAADEVVNQMFPEANMQVPTYVPHQAIQPDVIKNEVPTEEEMLFYSARAEMAGEKQGS